MILWWLWLWCIVGWQSTPSVTLDQEFAHIAKHPEALYRFLEEMPKGGELHYHFSGGVYPESMLQIAHESGQYCLRPDGTVRAAVRTKPCVPLDTADQDVFLIRAWSLQDFQPTRLQRANDYFFTTFPKFYELFVENRAKLLATVIKRAAAQHEHYLEIMTHEHTHYDAGGPLKLDDLQARYRWLLAQPAFQRTVQNSISTFRQVLSLARQDLNCTTHATQPACQVVVKFQYSVSRTVPLEEVFAQALHGFLLAQKSPEMVGVNLMGIEQDPHAARDYRAQMEIFQFLHQKYPQVHIALHAGELTQAIAPLAMRRTHIRDAIEIGHAERIGHGLDVLTERAPMALLKTMKEHGIAVEVNLTSNQLLCELQGADHPFLTYLQQGVPIVLSTDDEGVLRTHLTKEYVLAVQRYHLTYTQLKQLNRNTLTYSFLPGQSLWVNAARAVPVTACKDLQSVTCRQFIQQSEKATLQWRLEHALTHFEQQVTRDRSSVF